MTDTIREIFGYDRLEVNAANNNETLEIFMDGESYMLPELGSGRLAGAYRRAGFEEVILTPRSGDYGRDIIAARKDWGQVRFIDQVKAYKRGHLVTAAEVRELGHVLQADHNATKGFVTTTSDFAPRITEDIFIKPFLPYRIELVNGAALTERLNKLLQNP